MWIALLPWLLFGIGVVALLVAPRPARRRHRVAEPVTRASRSSALDEKERP